VGGSVDVDGWVHKDEEEQLYKDPEAEVVDHGLGRFLHLLEGSFEHEAAAAGRDLEHFFELGTEGFVIYVVTVVERSFLLKVFRITVSSSDQEKTD